MQFRVAAVICTVVFSAGFTAPATGAGAVIEDTFANAVYPDRTAGDGTQVAVASWAPKLGFAKFDLSAVAGSEVESAVLKLGVQWVKAAGSMGLHLVYND